MSACYRLKANYQWVQNHCGHTMIRPQLKRNAPLARVRGGYITARYVFDKNYIVNIPGKDDWQNQIVHVPEDIVCFADDSRLQSLSQARASIHNRTTGLDQIMPLGKYCMVFQAEVYAILTCANSLQSEQDASIAICSDSQAVLRALQSAKTTSSLVAETKSALKRLSVFNSVRLLWVPGHSNIPGNEVADALAKQAATSAFVGPEPAFGINMTTVSTEICRWANKEHQRVWDSTAGYRQSRLFLKGPDKKLSRYALGLSQQHLLVLTGLFTGHATLNRHLDVMKIRTDSICLPCGEEDETSVQFLGKCPATIMARHSILGAYFLRSVELRCIQPHALMRFARASKRFK